MSPIRSFKDLRAWQEAFALATDVDHVARLLPAERAPLADQLRRAEFLAPGEAVTEIEVRIRRVEQLLSRLIRHLTPPAPP